MRGGIGRREGGCEVQPPVLSPNHCWLHARQPACGPGPARGEDFRNGIPSLTLIIFIVSHHLPHKQPLYDVGEGLALYISSLDRNAYASAPIYPTRPDLRL